MCTTEEEDVPFGALGAAVKVIAVAGILTGAAAGAAAGGTRVGAILFFGFTGGALIFSPRVSNFEYLYICSEGENGRREQEEAKGSSEIMKQHILLASTTSGATVDVWAADLWLRWSRQFAVLSILARVKHLIH
jgi:mannose/fructose/N-acetylgalactosamine-specific phosphotransferase system component IID